MQTVNRDYLLQHKCKVKFFGLGPDDESWGYAVPVEVIEKAPILSSSNDPLMLEKLRSELEKLKKCIEIVEEQFSKGNSVTTNDPLTNEQLLRMDGKPVWLGDGRCYIVNHNHPKYLNPVGIDMFSQATDLELLTDIGLFRRPPEGA